MFTHMFDTTNPQASIERENELRKKWLKITAFFMQKGSKISLIYWPNDFSVVKEHQHSIYGITDLQLFKEKILTVENNMENMFCNISDEVKNIVLQYIPSDTETLVPWFHLNIINQSDEIIYSSQDKGSAVLVKLLPGDMNSLLKKGLDERDFKKI